MSEIVSPISIMNSLGYKVLIEKSNSLRPDYDGIFIQPGQVVDYQIDADFMREREFSQDLLTIHIYKAEEYLGPLTNIPINKIQSLTYQVNLGEDVPIIIEIEMTGTRKLLRVLSPLMVKNETFMSFKMLLRTISKSREVGAETRSYRFLQIYYRFRPHRH